MPRGGQEVRRLNQTRSWGHRHGPRETADDRKELLAAVHREGRAEHREARAADQRRLVTPVVGPEHFHGDGVVLVISHECDRIAGIDHGPDGLQRLPDLGAAIHVVPEKDGPSIRVGHGTVDHSIAEPVEERSEPYSVPVDVADEVDSGLAREEGWFRPGSSLFGMGFVVRTHRKRRVAR